MTEGTRSSDRLRYTGFVNNDTLRTTSIDLDWGWNLSSGTQDFCTLVSESPFTIYLREYVHTWVDMCTCVSLEPFGVYLPDSIHFIETNLNRVDRPRSVPPIRPCRSS